MKKSFAVALFLALIGATGMTALVNAQQQTGVSQNQNVVTGSDDQFLGDMFRQRQNEGVLGTSSVNPLHQMVAYNDYRTVDEFDDPGAVLPPSPTGVLHKLWNLLRSPWLLAFGDPDRGREVGGKTGDSAQAWIGLSFTDNGKDWYTGLHPGHPFDNSNLAQVLRVGPDGRGYQAASDPVIATTADKFFVGGIAFTPGPQGNSVGFVSRFVDRNDTETGRNIHYEWTKSLFVAPTGFFADKPNIAAGPDGHVYMAFVVFDQNDPQRLSSKIYFYRSADYGETWSTTPVILSDPLTRNQSPWILVDPNDENTVYVGWRVFANRSGGLANAIVGRKSTNGGVSFSPSIPYPVALLLKAFDQPQGKLPESLPIPRSNAYPTATIDGNGALHVAIQEYVNPNTGFPLLPGAPITNGVPRITVTSSYNGGVSWTLRRAVDFAPGSGTQFMPVLTALGEPGTSCPGSSGPRSRVMLSYYDARAGNVGTKPGPNGFVIGGDKQFDVRITTAPACPRDSANRLVFSPSVQMSRYSLSADPPHGIQKTAGFDFTAVNRGYSMFCGGNCAFTGDYIHLAPRVPYVLTPAGWRSTTSNAVDKAKLPAPVVQGVWADARDVKLPKDPVVAVPVTDPTFIDSLPWWNYQAPGSGKLPTQCQNPGARDQNIYTAEFAPGELFAAAPETFRTSNIPRAYPLYVENRAGTQRLFRLRIHPSPDALASFEFKSFDTVPPNFNVGGRNNLIADIVVGAYSSVTGSVIVGAGASAPIQITVEQVDGNGTAISGGARTAVTLFTAGAAPESQTETHPPLVSQTPFITKPFAGKTPLTFDQQTPFSQTPFSQTPFSQTPFSQTTFTQNPFSQTPFSQTPFSQTTTIFDVTDISFLVSNGGTNTAAFSTLLTIANAQLLEGLRTSNSYLFQVFINRLSPVALLNGCQSADGLENVQISNIRTPFSQTPFSQTPFSQTPFSQTPFSQTPFSQTPFSQTPFSQTTNPSDPAVSNSTFYVAPPSPVEQTARRQSPDAPRIVNARLTFAELEAALRGVNTQAPATDDFRNQRPTDVIMYSVRAFQIKPANDPTFVNLFSNDGEPQLGITVKSDAPDVVQQDGRAVFDPAGPQTSSGGAAVPVKLAFVTQPAASSAGAPFGVQVAVQDGFGNLVANSSLPVTIEIGANPGGGTLSGTLTRNAVNGIATFDDLSINNAGNGYALVATSGLLESATSAPFNVVTMLPDVMLPDLVVESLTHSPSSPTTADTITLTAVVKNNGPVAVAASTLLFTVGDETPGAPQTLYQVPVLAHLGFFTVQRHLSLSSGNYSTTATADYAEQIVETNESNNTTTDSYSVTESQTVVLPGDPQWIAVTPSGTAAEVSATQPRSGLGSLELVTGISRIARFAYTPTAPLGTYAQLSALSYDWYIDPESMGSQPALMKLRVYDASDPRTFLIGWGPCQPVCAPQPTGTWQTTNSLVNLSLFRGESGALPNSLAEIPPDAPITGIVIDGNFAFGGPWFGYVDNVTVGFGGSLPTVFNFEVNSPAQRRVRPAITWANPLPGAGNTTLSAAELNATANVAGAFTYLPPAGTTLAPEFHILTTSLAPSDAAQYLPTAKIVPLMVTGTSIVLPVGSQWSPYLPEPTGFAAVTNANKRSGTGSLELSRQLGQVSAFIREQRRLPLGRLNQLSALSYDWFIDPLSSVPRPPEIALRVYEYGDPRSFFLFWNACPAGECPIYPTGSWETTNVLGQLSIQSADGNPPPASLDQVPADAPITGIHVRTNHANGEAWHGFVDNVTIAFGDQAPPVVYNFEVGVGIENVALQSQTAVIDGPTVPYTATLKNNSAALGSVFVQAYVDQGSAVRSAGGAVVSCDGIPGSGNLPQGTCVFVSDFAASNTADGTGILLPGPAVARFELRQSNPPTLLDTYTVPITLTQPDLTVSVSVSIVDADASEAGPNEGRFQFTRTGSLLSGLAVTYDIGGTAINGLDYGHIPGSIFFAIGQATVDRVIEVNNDPSVEGDENVLLTLTDGADYNVGTEGTASLTITDNVTPVVTIATFDDDASEVAPNPGTFRFTRQGDLSFGLAVTYDIGGTAINGLDYGHIPGSIFFAIGEATVDRVIEVNNDPSVEGDENVLLTLTDGADYNVGTEGTASLTITDNVTPVVTIATFDDDASEVAPNPGTFRFTRQGDLSFGLAVTYDIGGTAINGLDYGHIPGSIFFAIGEATVDRVIEVNNDPSVEGDENVLLTLTDGADYNVGTEGTASLTITDNVTPVVTIATFDDDASEVAPNPGTFRFTRQGDLSFGLAVTYDIGGTAINGLDYGHIPGSIFFAIGQATADRVIEVNNDASAEGDETVILTLTDGADYNVGTSASASLTITDDDTPDRLGFVVQPSSSAAGAAIAPIQVAIQDAAGNTVTTATDAVTLGIGANPGSGGLFGTLTQNAVNGIATFNNLSISRAGDGYTLVATSGSFTATSQPFTIQPSVFTVTLTADSGPGSLRQAILDANARSLVTSTIRFNLTGEAPHTFTPASPLPLINASIIIDGTPGGPCAGAPTVVIHGGSAGLAHGLTVNSPGVTIRGIAVTGFAQSGIFLAGGGNNLVECNYVGLLPDGETPAGNEDGVLISGSSSNQVVGNVISGNSRYGTHISNGTANEIRTNFIGTNVDGTLAVPNGNGVVLLNSASNGTRIVGNLISGNTFRGIAIESGATGTVVEGNKVGTDRDGVTALPNQDGISIGNSSPGNTIGGTAPGAKNVISGNTNLGVAIYTGSSGNAVVGNFIGTTADGLARLANGFGVTIFAAANNIVGGTTTAARNVISGNTGQGISISDAAASGNAITGNFIGVNLAGAPLGNGTFGIWISGAAENTVGGPAAATANVIAFNTMQGVLIEGSGATQNAILSNSIHSNLELGIALNGINPTNDAGDADPGANEFQNYPVITSSSLSEVAGTLNSAASADYTIQLFVNPACDSSGFGEGHTLLDSFQVTTNIDGNASFSRSGFSLTIGQFLTATATDANGNTSAFSRCGLVNDQSPVADAGPDQSVNMGDTVQLNGTGSIDPDGTPLTYTWMFSSRPATSAATLTSPSSAAPTFIADVAGDFVLQLVVSDGFLESEDTVTIHSNAPPTAEAGPNQTVAVGATVQLDGSGSSDPEEAPLAFTWILNTKPPGSTAVLSATDIGNPTFVADRAGTYIAQLVVNDGFVNSASDTVTITTQNQAPVAIAGTDQTNVPVGTLVTLDGSASTDPDGTQVTYAWAFMLKPAGSGATLSSATSSSPTFVADVAGRYRIELVVSDGQAASAPDTVDVTTPNRPPVANAGSDQSNVAIGSTVHLNGGGSSDPDGNPLSYLWTLVSKPGASGATLTGATTSTPSFVADIAGQYTIRLVVNDGTVASAPDDVVITVVDNIGLALVNTNLIGLGRSAGLRITLPDDAGAGGVQVTVTSDNPAIVSVGPPNVITIPAGQRIGQVTLNGEAVGTTMVRAAAPGFGQGMLSVSVSQNLITVPATLNVPYTQTTQFPVSIGPNAAPAGGLSINVQSDNPSLIEVLTPTITIPAGAFGANATVRGLSVGSATVLASNATFSSASSLVSSTGALNILQASATFTPGFPTSVTVRLESGGAAVAAPAGGQSVTLTAANPACLSVPVSVTIPAGLVSTTISLAYGGSAGLPCTTSLTASGSSLTSDSINVTVNPNPSISGFATTTVGAGLQNGFFAFTLGLSQHGGTTVRIASGDPSKVLVSPNSTTPGAAFIDITVSNGSSSANFYIQGVEGTTATNVTITGSATGFGSGTGNVNVVQPAVRLLGPATSMSSLGTDDLFTVRVGTPNGTTNLSAMAVRAGLTLTATVTNSNGTVGQLKTQAGASSSNRTVNITGGNFDSPGSLPAGGIAFDPLAPGETDVAVSIPGFLQITVSSVHVTVTAPGITGFGTPTVGAGLQSGFFAFALGGSQHGGVTVRIESGDASKVLVSPNSTTPGTASINVALANGQTSALFYIQGVENTTTTTNVTITASAPGFNNGTGSVAVVQPAVRLIGPTSTTSLSPDDPFTVRVGTPNGTTNLSAMAVRAGRTLTATVTNSNGAVGQLKTLAGSDPHTVTISGGNFDSPGSVAAGGIAFDPISGGTTTVAVSIPGFIEITLATVDVTVSAPGITGFGTPTVGAGLQSGFFAFALGGSQHGGVTVRIESGDASKVLVSPNSTTPGTASINVALANGQTSALFYIQGVENTTTTTNVTITASAPGFNNGTGSVAVVQPAVRLIGPGTSTTSLSPDDPFTVRVGTPNGTTNLSAMAVRAGQTLTATVTNSNGAIGQLKTLAGSNPSSRTVTISGGNFDSPGSVAAGGIAFDPISGGTTTVAVSIPGFIEITLATVNVTVSAPGITSFGTTTVGAGLQSGFFAFTLGGSQHGGVTVRIESSSGNVARVAPNSTTPGTTFIDVPVANGNTSALFYVQGMENMTGTVVVTASAPGFTSNTGTVDVVQPAVRLVGPATSTTSLSANDLFTVRVGTPSGNNVNAMAVRAGQSLTATVTNSNGTAARLTTSAGSDPSSRAVTIAAGNFDSPGSIEGGGIAFDPLAPGETDVAVSIPGFIQTPLAFVHVTVSSPGIAGFGSTTVGAGLQNGFFTFTLGGSQHGGVTVHIASGDPRVLVSTNSTTAGAASVDIPLANGSTHANFYIHGLENTTGASLPITASAPGFSNGTGSVDVVQPGLRIISLGTSISATAASAPFAIRVGLPDAGETTVSAMAVRAGFSLLATVNNSTASVAQLVTNAGGAQSRTVTISGGSFDSPSTVLAGGIALDPLSAGQTAVNATIPGLIATTAATVNVTVNP